MRLEPCKLCGDVDYRMYLPRVYALGERTFDLVRCQGCGLVRVSPLPPADEVRALYDEKYFVRDFSCGVRAGTYLETDATRVGEYRELLDTIRKYRPLGRFLEVGCAAGSFLNYARRAGYEVEGVDVSPWAADTAREQFGLAVHTGRLVELKLPEKSFDVVFLGDILEHEPEPAQFLAEVKRVLRPWGLLALKVPTYVNSFYYRAARRIPISWTMGRLDNRLLEALKLSFTGPRLPPYHLFEFSNENIRALCAKTGLQIIDRRHSLLVPEFLSHGTTTGLNRTASLGFALLRGLVRVFNLPAGHVLVLAVRESD